MYLHLEYVDYKKIYNWKVGNFGILLLGLKVSKAFSISHTSFYSTGILTQKTDPVSVSVSHHSTRSYFVLLCLCLFFLCFFFSVYPGGKRAELHQGAFDSNTFQRTENAVTTSLYV